MRRRALLHAIAVGIPTVLAGCGGSDDDGTPAGTTTTTTTQTTSGTSPPVDDVTSTAPLIEASMDELKLRVDDLPADENWTFLREDDNSTRFELDNNENLTGYILEASILAHADLETAVTAYRDRRDRADSYTGITVSAVDLGVEAFGFQLTEDTGTVVVRDANVVGELEYTLDYDSTGDHSVRLQTVVDYTDRWVTTWR